MKRWWLAVCLTFLSLGAWAGDAALTKLPQGLGLPVLVRAGLSFVTLQGIAENDGTFTATVDVRLRWQDLRLSFDAAHEAAGYQEYLDEEADKKLAEIWQPKVVFGNQKGERTFYKPNLRIFPSGQVELMQRTTATFTSDFPLENFPFDRQKLVVELVSRIEPLQRVQLDFRQDELEYQSQGSIHRLPAGQLQLGK